MKDQHWHEDFANKHGDSVIDDNWLLFQDGARMERSAYGMKQLPPDDPQLLRQLLLRYWSIRVNLLSTRFNAKKIELQRAAADGVVSPTAEQIAELEALHKEVLAAKQHAEELQEQDNNDFAEEYENAKTIYKQWQRAKGHLEKTRRKMNEARQAGRGSTVGYRDLSKECDSLRVTANELSRQWRNCSGDARHQVLDEIKERECSAAADKLNSIEI